MYRIKKKKKYIFCYIIYNTRWPGLGFARDRSLGSLIKIKT